MRTALNPQTGEMLGLVAGQWVQIRPPTQPAALPAPAAAKASPLPPPTGRRRAAGFLESFGSAAADAAGPQTLDTLAGAARGGAQLVGRPGAADPVAERLEGWARAAREGLPEAPLPESIGEAWERPGEAAGAFLGTGVGSTAPTVATGAAGALLGTAFGPAGAAMGTAVGVTAPSLLLNFGDNYQALLGWGADPETAARTAAIAAFPQAVLERFGVEQMLGGGKQVYGPWLKRLGKAGGRSAVTEGAEEGAQQAIQEAAGAAVAPEYDPEGAPGRIGMNVALGAAGGAQIGAGIEAARKPLRTLPLPKPDTPAQAEAPPIPEPKPAKGGEPAEVTVPVKRAATWEPVYASDADDAPVVKYRNKATGEERTPAQHMAPIPTPLSGIPPVLPGLERDKVKTPAPANEGAWPKVGNQNRQGAGKPDLVLGEKEKRAATLDDFMEMVAKRVVEKQRAAEKNIPGSIPGAAGKFADPMQAGRERRRRILRELEPLVAQAVQRKQGEDKKGLAQRRLAKLLELEPLIAKAVERRKALAAKVEEAAAKTNPAPTEAQKEAGNYAKGRVNLQGLDISIETPKGAMRRGKAPDGTAWENESPAHYGYIKRTTGSDGEQVDVYVGDHPASDRAFVFDQIDPDTGEHDEHKVVLGARSRGEAKAIYEGGFSDGSGPQRWNDVQELSIDEFKGWLGQGQKERPSSAPEPAGLAEPAPAAALPEMAAAEAPEPAGALVPPQPDSDATPDQLRKAIEDGDRAIAQGINPATGRPFRAGADGDKVRKQWAVSRATLEAGLAGAEPVFISSPSNKAAKMDTPPASPESKPKKPKKGDHNYLPPAPTVDGLPEGVTLRPDPGDFVHHTWIEALGPDGKVVRRAKRADLKTASGRDAFVRGINDSLVERRAVAKEPAQKVKLTPDASRADGETLPPAIPPQEEAPGTVGENPPVESPGIAPSGNRLVTDERADEIRKKLRAKFTGQLSSGVDPEILAMGAELAVYHLERGARAFAAWSKRILDDLGEDVADKVRPFLRGWYENARYYPGLDTTGMTPAAEIDNPPPPTEPDGDKEPAPEPEPGAPAPLTPEGSLVPVEGTPGEPPARIVHAVPPAEPAPAPTFEKGDRVVLQDGQHGAITDVIELTMTPIVGGYGAHKLPPYFTVRLDSGPERSARLEELKPETGTAPKAIPAPKWKGKPIPADGLERLIAGKRSDAKRLRASARTRRKIAFRQADLQAAARADAAAAEAQAILDAWRQAYPEEAARTLAPITENVPPVQAKPGQPAPVPPENELTAVRTTIYGPGVQFTARVERDRYEVVAEVARRHGGVWNKRARALIFPNWAAAEAFKAEVENKGATPVPPGDTAAPELPQSANARLVAEAEPRMPEGWHIKTETWQPGGPRTPVRTRMYATDPQGRSQGRGLDLDGLTPAYMEALVADAQMMAAAPALTSPPEPDTDAGTWRRYIEASLPDGYRMTADFSGFGWAPPPESGRPGRLFDMPMTADMRARVIIHSAREDAAKAAAEAPAPLQDAEPETIPEDVGPGAPETPDVEPTQAVGAGPAESEAEPIPFPAEEGDAATGSGAAGGRGERAGRADQAAPATARRSSAAARRAGEAGSGSGRPSPGRGTPGRPRSLSVAKRAAEATKPGDLPSNFRIERDDSAPGQKGKYQANVAAIRALDAVLAEQRRPTAEELDAMSRYVGWGGIPQAFENQVTGKITAGWEKEVAELEQLLTPEQLAAARATTLNAHYTSLPIVRAMWNGLTSLGFKGGRVLEPGMGIGNFLGTVPEPIAPATRFLGVEIDGITGQLAQQIYPNADIRIAGFEDVTVPRGYVDAVIGNVPFHSAGPFDPAYNPDGKLSLHNYFIWKAAHLLRPGGGMMLITSHFTMDAKDSSFRRRLADQGGLDLVTMARLPSSAFKASAGTEVTTDVLVFRKRLPGEAPGDASWTTTRTVALPHGGSVQINEWLADRPENALGRHSNEDKLHASGGYSLAPDDRGDPVVRLEALLTALPRVLTEAPIDIATDASTPSPRAPAEIPIGSLFVDGDTVLRKTPDGMSEPVEVTKGGRDKIVSLIGLREAFARTLATQVENAPEADQEAARKDLVAQYRAFVAKHGAVNKVKLITRTEREEDPDTGEPVDVETEYEVYENLREFEKLDSAAYMVGGLDTHNPRTGEVREGDVLHRRIIQPRMPDPKAVKTPQDALLYSFNVRGRLDLPTIADVLGMDEAHAEAALGDLAYRDPATGELVDAEKYLSGDVRLKLEQAEAGGDAYKRNVAALKPVVPKDIPFTDIRANLGAPWLRPKDMTGFIEHLFENRSYRMGARFLAETGAWHITDYPYASQSAQTRWGTPKVSLKSLVEDLISGRPTKVADKDSEGKSHPDQAGTDEAAEKKRQINEEFSRWLWSSPERTQELTKAYNRQFNNVALRRYDGSHLTLPGTAEIALDKHQKDQVWKTLQEPNSLLAHTVGAGKTFTMAAAAMEEKRLGLTRKPAFIVPNHMLGQFQRELLMLYPQARVMTADSEAFHTSTRRRFVARVAASDLDAVIITHSAFSRLPLSAAQQREFIEAEIATFIDILRSEGSQDKDIDEMTGTIEAQLSSEEKLIAAAAAAVKGTKRKPMPVKLSTTVATKGRKSPTVKDAEGAILRLTRRLRQVLAAINTHTDVGLSFEDSGIDRIYVDEAHLFKNLGFATKMSGLRGLSPGSRSQRAMDLFMKVQWLQKAKGGRAAVFATATPVSNSMAELFIMQRYLQLPELRARSIQSFDAWAHQFGSVESTISINPAGTKLEEKQRFAKLVNLPELYQMLAPVMTYLSPGELREIKKGTALALPETRREVITAPDTPALEALREELDARTEAIRDREVEPTEDNMLKVAGDGRKAALDLRLVGRKYEEPGQAKIVRVADQIARIHKLTTENTYVDPATGDLSPAKGGAQIVFIDLSTPGDNWNLYDELRDLLAARGIKKSQVAYVHNAKTPEQKEDLFEEVRSGKVRILLGSTAKMGVGTNVQRRLVALHHVDPPWRPADLEQREGRAVRQGNQNSEVSVIRYATEKSFDAYTWQLLEAKARGIQGFLAGDPTLREVDDVGMDVDDYEAMKSISLADPLMTESFRLRREVERLTSLKNAHENTQRHIAWQMNKAAASAMTYRRRLRDVQADAAQAQDMRGKAFAMEVRGTVHTDRAEAVAALQAAIMKSIGETYGPPLGPRRYGTFAGFPFNVEIKSGVRAGRYLVSTQLVSKTAPEGESVEFNEKSELIGQMMFDQLEKIGWPTWWQNRISGIERGIASDEAEAASLKSAVGKPFEHLDKLVGAAARLTEVTAELNARTVKAQPKARRIALATDAGMPATAAALAREIGTLLQRITGGRAKVSVEGAITDNGGLIAGAYLNGLIRVALADGAGRLRYGGMVLRTARHEAIHFLRDVGAFTPGQWKALQAHAADWRREFGIDEIYANDGLSSEALDEEAIAEAYARWGDKVPVKASTDVKGAFAVLRRILQAVRDALRKVFGRIPSPEEVIFEAIERGDFASEGEAEFDGEARAQRPGLTAGSLFQYDIAGTIQALDRENYSLIQRGLSDRTKGDVGHMLDKARHFFQDRFLFVRRVQEAAERVLGRPLTEAEDVYAAEERMASKVMEAKARLDWDFKEPILEAMKASGLTMPQVDRYLTALHAHERNAYIRQINPKLPDGGSGITDQEATDRLAELRGLPQETRQAFERIAGLVREMLDQRRDRLVEAGLLAPAMADRWNRAYAYYVPLRGVDDGEVDGELREALKMGSGRGLMGSRRLEPRATGRFTEAPDILATAFAIADEAIVRAEKNRVGQHLLELATAAPDKRIWEVRPGETRAYMKKVPVRTLVNGKMKTTYREEVDYKRVPHYSPEDTVTVRVGGEEHLIQIHDPWILRSFKKLGGEQQGALVATLGKITRVLSHLNTTWNPEFILTNAFADAQTGLVNIGKEQIPGIRKKVLAGWKDGFRGSYRYITTGKADTEAARWAQRFRQAGGAVAFNQIADVESQVRTIEEALATFQSSKATTIKRGIAKFGSAIENANIAVDNAMRVGTFRALVESGMSDAKAASIAKNLTVNFNRKGEWGPAANALFLFFNAATQGTAILLRAMKAKPVRRFVYGIVAAGVMQELLASLIPPPEDDDGDGRNVYERVPEWVKQRNMVIPYGPEPGQYVMIRMPYGFNSLHSLGRSIAAYARGAREDTGEKVGLGQTVARVASATAQAFMPPGVTDLLVPTIAAPFVEIASNEDFFERPIMPQQFPGDTGPDSQRYFNSVNPLAREVAGFLNSMTGGDEFRPGLIDVSPESIEHVIKVFSGAAGAQVVDLVSTGQRLTGEVLGTNVENPQLSVRDVPFVRKVMGTSSPWQMRDVTYRRLDELAILGDEMKARKGRDLGELRREKGPLLALVDDGGRLRRELGKMRKERLAILANDAPAAARRARLEKLEARETALMTAFNRRYLQALRRVESREAAAEAA